MNLTRAKIGLMLDVETLGLKSNAVAWQSALYGWDMLDPDTILEHSHHQYLAIQPQLDAGREIAASTMLFWMKPEQADALVNIQLCDSEDPEELGAMLRHLLRSFNRMTEDGTLAYELWQRGNFDIPIIESLLKLYGLPVPWTFRETRDLRTLEAISGVSYKDVPQPAGFIKHRADWDCLFQIKHHTACMAALAKG